MYAILTSEAFIKAANQLGANQLRPHQKAPAIRIMEGHDVLVKMPTGGGKSLLFQLPALLEQNENSNKGTLVISPMRALQKNQCDALTQKGVNAYLLNSDLTSTEHRKVLGQFAADGGLLYLAAEQLDNTAVHDTLLHANIVRIVVDEAHVLPQVQDDFRQAYGRIGNFVRHLACRPQIVALTATATRRDTKIIRNSLGMQDAITFDLPIRRDNLHLSIKKVSPSGKQKIRRSLESNRFQAVERVLDNWDGNGSVIIYCPTIKKVKTLQRRLKGLNYKAGKYHGKMKRKKREKAQTRFMSGKTPIMVATNAFGLGIDKPDVRLVIHAGLPLSFDGYVQEIGRAGRDGKKSKCILFYADGDFAANERILTRGSRKKALRHKRKRLHALHKMIQSDRCIWKTIEAYFGQKKQKRCAECCNCRRNSN